ncbi:MAG: esterase-like activity of phytase family protein [Moraxellaceae bacterium]|nr:esterase-like activity of phytase family protein [Moraxellaceae bacterium]
MLPLLRTSTLLLAASLTLTGCDDDNKTRPATTVATPTPDFALPPAAGSLLPHTVMTTHTTAGGDMVQIRNGGFGSAMVGHPTKPGYFYALTDRGPNAATAAGVTPSGIIFVMPDYTPRIGLFRLTTSGNVELVQSTLLKDWNDRYISGLPNDSFGATGETPYALGGGTVSLDPDNNGTAGFDLSGLDGEGLVALKDGSFWTSDEYGPHMVHFDADGSEIGRINPFRDDTRNRSNRYLPAELAKRWPNRGMEGLAITPDEKTLVGIMQSSLDNPSQAAARSTDLTRIVLVDMETGATRQYLYRQEANGHSNSEISTLTANSFAVIERDQKFYGRNGTGSGTGAGNIFKRVYKATLSGATNIDTSNSALIASHADITDGGNLGLLIQGKTLEQFIKDNGAAGWTTLAGLGIVPVSKSLIFDAVANLNYPHDKMEGLWVIDSTTLGIINDDDFALEPDGSGGIKQKVLHNSQVDGNRLYVVKLTTPMF